MSTPTHETARTGEVAQNAPTTGPWTLDGKMIFAPRIGGLIAQTYDNAGTGSDKCAKANAAFIVRACNSHAALVEALESVLAALDEANGDPRHPEAIKARAALAQAKGGQQ